MGIVLPAIRLVCFVLVCASMAYYFLAAAAAMRFARHAARPCPLPPSPPSMALLKPLHGHDEDLLGNLDSFLDQDYPDKRYVFGVSTGSDPALDALNEIKRRYPSASIIQTVGDEPSVNRKVGKLMRMLRQPPQADVLVMSDADVRVQPDYLRRIAAELAAEERTGIVTCTYGGIVLHGSLGAKLEASFVNTDFTPTAILSYYLEPMRHAFAATVAIRTSTLEEAGGLETVKNSFGDDFALARRVSALGRRIKLSSSVVTMAIGRMSFREFWEHQMRWARVDRKIRPISLARLGINGPFWALAFLLACGFGWPSIAIAGAVVGARLGMSVWTVRRVLRLPLRFVDLALIPLKDLIMQAVWVASLAGDEVEWRGRKLRLLASGEMEEVM